VTVAILALGAFPAFALAASGGHPNRPTTHTTGPTNAKAYGKFCQGESK
jgi:hypothetical protein